MKFFPFKDEKGNVVLLRRKNFQDTFKGRKRLFQWSWKRFLTNCYTEQMEVSEAENWLETFASESVNNPKSSFYIYG